MLSCSASAFSQLTHCDTPSLSLPRCLLDVPQTMRDGGSGYMTQTLLFGWTFLGTCPFSGSICRLKHLLSIWATSNDLHIFGFFFSYFISYIVYFITLFLPNKLLYQILVSGFVSRGTRKCHLYLSSPSKCLFN